MSNETKLTVEDCQEISDFVIKNVDGIVQAAKTVSDPMVDGETAIWARVYSELVAKLRLENDFRKPVEGAISYAASYDLRIREIVQAHSMDFDGCFRCFDKLNQLATAARGK